MTSLRCHEWDNHQTYRRDRPPPPWIKVHRNIMSNRKWARLTDAEKGQLVSLWILAADKNGEIPNEPDLLRKLCMLDDLPNISKFIELGLLTPIGRQSDAKAASEERQNDAPEAEAKAKAEKKKPAPTAARFGDWWDLYDKKVKRKPAEQIWKRKRLDLKADQIIADTQERHKRDERWRKGYQPDPTTYLNQERWQDEITEFVGREPMPSDPQKWESWAVKHGFRRRKEGESLTLYRDQLKVMSQNA